MLRAPPYENPGALRGACVAQELRKSLGETREWVEQLDEELGVAQAVIFSLRREVNLLKHKAGTDSERDQHQRF